MVGVVRVFTEVDLHPVDRAGEDALPTRVVVADGGCGVAPHVQGLVGGKDHGDRALDTALADLVPVDVERHRASLGEASSVVGELHAHLVVSDGDG